MRAENRPWASSGPKEFIKVYEVNPVYTVETIETVETVETLKEDQRQRSPPFPWTR